MSAKFWLDPVSLVYSRGFHRADLRRIEQLAEEHASFLLGAWNEYFGH